jgi:serine/threonine protein kinase
MGDMPISFALSGKYSDKIFDSNGTFVFLLYRSVHIYQCSASLPGTPSGKLHRISKLRYWGLEAVLREKYLIPAPDAEAITSFLTPMLQVDPEKRAPPHELLCHPWLTGEAVQDDKGVDDTSEEKAKVEVRARAEEEARTRAEEEVRTRAEEEVRTRAEEEVKAKSEEEAKAKAKAEAEAKAKVEAEVSDPDNELFDVCRTILVMIKC